MNWIKNYKITNALFTDNPETISKYQICTVWPPKKIIIILLKGVNKCWLIETQIGYSVVCYSIHAREGRWPWATTFFFGFIVFCQPWTTTIRLKYTILKRNSCWKRKILRHGRPNRCGILLPDVKKLICGTEGEKIVTNLVARLSPADTTPKVMMKIRGKVMKLLLKNCPILNPDTESVFPLSRIYL